MRPVSFAGSTGAASGSVAAWSGGLRRGRGRARPRHDDHPDQPGADMRADHRTHLRHQQPRDVEAFAQPRGHLLGTGRGGEVLHGDVDRPLARRLRGELDEPLRRGGRIGAAATSSIPPPPSAVSAAASTA